MSSLDLTIEYLNGLFEQRANMYYKEECERGMDPWLFSCLVVHVLVLCTKSTHFGFFILFLALAWLGPLFYPYQ